MFAGASALAQDWGDDAEDRAHCATRIQRLERDMHDLQHGGLSRQGRGAPRHAGAAAASDDLPPARQPVAQRVSDMETMLQRLTGQLEELQHQNSVLQPNSTGSSASSSIRGTAAPAPCRAPKDRRRTRTVEPPPEPSESSLPARGVPSARNESPSAEPQGLAPGPSNLGTIPRNTPLPVPKPYRRGRR